MLKVDGSLDNIPAKRAHVVSLHESINQPLVNIPGYGAAPTGAFILGTRNDHGAFTVFVYLYQPQTRAVLIYVSEPRSLGAEQLELEEKEAVRFVESMGFMVDDVQFSRLPVGEQEAVMERVPIFRPLRAPGVVEGAPSQARFGALGGVVTGRPESGSWPKDGVSSSLPSGLPPVAGTPAGRVGGSPPSGGGAAARPRGPTTELDEWRSGAGSHHSSPSGAFESRGGANGEATGAPRLASFGADLDLGLDDESGGSPETWGSAPAPSVPPSPSSLSPSSVAARSVPPLSGPAARPEAGPAGRAETGPGFGSGPGSGFGSASRSLGRGLPAMGGARSSPPREGGAGSEGTPSRPAPESAASPGAGRGGEPDPASLARIGRLLGTFGLLIAVSVPPAGCATGPSRREERAHEARVDLGHRELARAQWAEALRHFEEVLASDGDDGPANRGAGLAYWRLGRLEKAEAHLRRAVESDPKWSEPKNDLAAVLTEQGRCDEAIELLELVIDDVFYPTHHFAEHNLAKAEACAGRLRDAVARLERLTERRPKFCLAYLTASELAESGALNEATVEACEAFRQNCERDEEIGDRIPPRIKATCDLRKGRAYAALGDVESARTALERCSVAKSTGQACREALGGLPP